MDDFTIIDDGQISNVAAVIDGATVRLPAQALRAALGWELKPQGLCRDEICISIGTDSHLATADGIDLAGVAELLQRPLALDVEEHAAYLGVSAQQRSSQLGSLKAPEFTLPDLDGNLHSLGQYRGKKILLLAYASW